MPSVIFHVDVNSAFLSWEAAERLANDPDAVDLRDIPSAVGGDESRRHGIILAKSTPAKAYHVTTGEPIAQALKKCPELVIVQPTFGLYARRSGELMELLSEYAPEVDPFSVDEAFLNMTGTAALYGDPVVFAHTLKDEIKRRLGFTVNVGVSSNKLLAKMASDFQKPDRVHTLFPEEIETKMWPLPVSELLFVGKSTVAELHKIGIFTIGELAAADEASLVLRFGKHGRTMIAYANGISTDSFSHEEELRKSYSNETTTSHDIVSADEAKLILLSLAESVAFRLRRDRGVIGVVTVKLRDKDFKNTSRQVTLDTPTNATQLIFDTACTLFDELWKGQPLRLLGISTAKYEESGVEQLSLFDQEKRDKLKRLDAALDDVKNKYGRDAVKRATQI